MTYLVVVSQLDSDKPNQLYEGKCLMRVLRKIRDQHAARHYVDWTHEMDDYLRAHDEDTPRSKMAKDMSEKFGEMFTKGAVIRRCIKLGL